MAALSKHRGGEEDRERPECVHSSAIQTDLKPTGAGAFSPQPCFSLVGPLPPTPPPLPLCKSASLFSYLFLYHFLPSVFHSRLTGPGLPQWDTNNEGKLNRRPTCAHAAMPACAQKGCAQWHKNRAASPAVCCISLL